MTMMMMMMKDEIYTLRLTKIQKQQKPQHIQCYMVARINLGVCGNELVTLHILDNFKMVSVTSAECMIFVSRVEAFLRPLGFAPIRHFTIQQDTSGRIMMVMMMTMMMVISRRKAVSNISKY